MIEFLTNGSRRPGARVFLLAGLAILLLGCGGRAGPSQNEAQLSCARLAEENEQVRDMWARENTGWTTSVNMRNERLALQRQIEVNCLRRRGDAPIGGVERVQPLY